MQKFGLWILMTALLMVLLPVQAQEGALYSTETVQCPDGNNFAATMEGEVEGETYECGVIVVPENYDKPDGRTIELVYLRMFSTGESPAPDPLLYLSGGPGGSALTEMNPASPLFPNLQIIRQDRDIVAYDQRGTGLSAPITCGPFQAAIGLAVELMPELAEDIMKIEGDSRGAKVLNYAVCAGTYAEGGVDLTQFNSIRSAQDMASLMTALGYDQYNLMGTSYGTKLSQVALRETPDRVRSVVLDGTTPITGAVIASVGIEANEQWVHIFEECAADEACNAAYPDLPERFTALLDKLAANPITLDEPIMPVGIAPAIVPPIAAGIDTIDVSFFGLLAYLNNASANYVYQGRDFDILLPKMLRMIQAVEEGDTDYIRNVFEDSPMPDNRQPEVDAEVFQDESTIQPANQFVAASVSTLLAEAAREVDDASTPEEQWVALAINDLVDRLDAGEEQTAVIEDMMELAMLPVQGLDPQILVDYANERMSEDAAAAANDLAAGMTRSDVRYTMWHLTDIAAGMSFLGPALDSRHLHEGLMYAVDCPESVVLHSQADVDAAVAEAAYPQLMTWDPEDNEWAFYDLLCSFFPPTDYIDAHFLDPVISDTPALLLQGALDTQTPLSGALEVAGYLSNSQVVIAASEGHVISAKFYPCPGQIIAQFLNDPLSEVDSSCVANYVIGFDLPE